MTDGQRRTVDFRQTLVLMTSNLRDENQVRWFFRPEFINRLDDILVFDALTQDQICAIVGVQPKRLSKHLSKQEIALELTQGAWDELDQIRSRSRGHECEPRSMRRQLVARPTVPRPRVPSEFAAALGRVAPTCATA